MINLIYFTKFKFNWRYYIVILCYFILLSANSQLYIKRVYNVSSLRCSSVFDNGCIEKKENTILIQPNPGNKNVSLDCISEAILTFQFLDSRGIVVLPKTFKCTISNLPISFKGLHYFSQLLLWEFPIKIHQIFAVKVT